MWIRCENAIIGCFERRTRVETGSEKQTRYPESLNIRCEGELRTSESDKHAYVLRDCVRLFAYLVELE